MIGPTPDDQANALVIAVFASESHDVGTNRFNSGTIDDYGNNNGTGRGSSLQVITLPSDALSAWYTGPEELVWVDTDPLAIAANGRAAEGIELTSEVLQIW